MEMLMKVNYLIILDLIIITLKYHFLPFIIHILSEYIYIKINCRFYVISSHEKGSTDLTDFLFVVFLIVVGTKFS